MNLVTVPSDGCSTQHTRDSESIFCVFRQKTEGHRTEVLEHGLGSSLLTSLGLGVGDFQAHQLVLVRGHWGAQGSCPKNEVSHVQEKRLLRFPPPHTHDLG